jgi:hypothetical protein
VLEFIVRMIQRKSLCPSFVLLGEKNHVSKSTAFASPALADMIWNLVEVSARSFGYAKPTTTTNSRLPVDITLLDLDKGLPKGRCLLLDNSNLISCIGLVYIFDIVYKLVFRSCHGSSSGRRQYTAISRPLRTLAIYSCNVSWNRSLHSPAASTGLLIFF